MTFMRRAMRMDCLSIAPSSTKMTPRAVSSLYQPPMSVSRIEGKIADTALLRRTLPPLQFESGFAASSNINTKSFRERSARFLSKQSARRNSGSGRTPCSSVNERSPREWFPGESRAPRRRGDSLDRHAFGEIPRLVHVAAPKHPQVIRQELKRQGDRDWLEPLQARRNGDHKIGLGLDVLVAFRRHGDHYSVSCLDLFEVAGHLVVRGSHRGDGDDRHAPVDEGDGPMLHLPCRVPLGVNVRDLLELEGALQGQGIVETAP